MERKEYSDWLSSFCNPESVLAHKIADSFRVNTLKISLEIFDQISNLERKEISWYNNAFLSTDKIQLGKTLEFALGYIHTQSLSSMVPPLVLDPQKREKILDLTAAPGSKTTQISTFMENTGLVVANDLPERELAILGNVSRLGVLNVVISSKDARDYPLKAYFDRVLVDAPCSALGSNPEAYERFSEDSSKAISPVQKRILEKGFEAVKSGGTVVYSTCSYSPEENESVVNHILDSYESAELEKIDLDIPHDSGLIEFGKEFSNCWRIYPKHFDSEGFFVAKIRKKEI